MGYLGRVPSPVPVTADDIPANSIDASKIEDGAIAVADVADNAITEDKIADAAVVNLKSGRKNLLINGGFDVWQRGTSFSSSNADIFASDRWSINSIGATQRSVDKVFNTVTESSAMRIVLSNTGNLQIIQKIEGFKHLHNKPIAISFYAKSTGMTSIYVKLRVYHTGGSTEIESGVTTLTSTFSKKTILVNAKDLSSYTEDGSSSMRFELQTISGTSGDTIEITQVQLEVGSQATDFEHRSHGEELALCQRYYQRYENNTETNIITRGNETVYGSTVVQNHFDFITQMRGLPTLETSGVDVFSSYSNSGSTSTSTAISGSMYSTFGARVNITAGGNQVAGNACKSYIRIGKWLAFNAEL